MKQEEILLYQDMETKEQTCVDEAAELCEAAAAAAGEGEGQGEGEGEGEGEAAAALGALLEAAGAAGAGADPELRVRRLAERAARLDALNVAGMLAATTEGGGARLADRLAAAARAGAALRDRHARLDALAHPRGAPDAALARSDAARADGGARALLAELEATFGWLDAPPLRAPAAEPALGCAEGRARALRAALAVRAALRAERDQPPARLRLAAVRERLRRLARLRDQLAAALARHLNNTLIHLGNEANLAGEGAQDGRPHRHHAELLPYAPFMRWLKQMDEKAFEALEKVYAGTWARVYERELHAACEQARAALQAAPPERADPLLDAVLTTVEGICNTEQDFCAQFFFLDVDVKAESGDEKSERGDACARAGGDTRRLMAELFPSLEQELVALVGHIERHDP